MPEVGSQPRVRANSSSNISPSQKSGSEMPRHDTSVAPTSKIELHLTAERMPIGTARISANSIVTSHSWADAPRRWVIISVTG
jgi:hypothetical protein